MTIMTLTLEQVSLNLFYFGISLLLLGSIVRREVELKKVKHGLMKVPPIDGRHDQLGKALMYPLKVIGYLLAVSAIWAHISYEPISYSLLISYISIISIHAAIPFCFKPAEDYSQRDNWSVQRERLTAAKGVYTVAILLFPTSIFGDRCLGHIVLLFVFLYEVFIFSNREQKVWEKYAHFDIDHSEEMPRTSSTTD